MYKPTADVARDVRNIPVNYSVGGKSQFLISINNHLTFRCCTATVRRSVPFQVAEPEEDNSIQEQLQETRRRSLAEISSIISLLEQKERRSPSKRVRTELHRTRQRLERYGKVRYGDLIDQQEQSTDKQFNEDEKEMYDVLERIIKRLVQKHTEDTTPVDKRSVDMLVEEPVRRTTEQRLAKLFRL